MFKRRRTVLLNLTTDKTFRGVLWRRGWRYYRLRMVTMLDGTTEIPVDGEVVFPRDRVEFYQVVD